MIQSLESTTPEGRLAGLPDGEAGNRTSYSPVGAGTGAELGKKALPNGQLYTHMNFNTYKFSMCSIAT